MTRTLPLPLSLVAAAILLAAAPAASGQPQKKPQTDSGGGDAPGASSVRAAPMQTGEQIYKQVCQACHMADGKGGDGAGRIPALASNPRLTAPAYPIIMVAKGRGAMPWFNDTLTPAQTAEIVTYIRTHFGNDYKGAVTEADVLKITGPYPTGPVDAH